MKCYPFIGVFHIVYSVYKDVVIPPLSSSVFPVFSGAWTKYSDIVHWPQMGDVPSLWQLVLGAGRVGPSRQAYGARPAQTHTRHWRIQA